MVLQTIWLVDPVPDAKCEARATFFLDPLSCSSRPASARPELRPGQPDAGPAGRFVDPGYGCPVSTTIEIELADVRISALRFGSPNAPLTLLLHGYPDTAWTWRHLGPALAAEGRQVVAPFMRGYGPSGGAPDGCYQIATLAEDALAIAERLGGGRPIGLVGHDWGAIAAATAAAIKPEVIDRIVTLAVPQLAPLLWSSWLLRNPGLLAAQLRRSWYIFFQQIPGVAERSLDWVVPKLWRDWSPGYDATEDLENFWRSVNTPARRTAVLRYYRAFLQPWFQQPRRWAGQRGWTRPPTMPWLYLHGERDGCLGADLARAAIAAAPTPNQHSVLPGVGHFLHLEDPDRVNPLISSFLAG